MECGGFDREKENKINSGNEHDELEVSRCDGLSQNFGSSAFLGLYTTSGQNEHSSRKGKSGPTCAFIILY